MPILVMTVYGALVVWAALLIMGLRRHRYRLRRHTACWRTRRASSAAATGDGGTKAR